MKRWQVVTLFVKALGLKTEIPGPTFRRRLDAEAFAARRSAFAGHAYVRPVGGNWVSQYRNGYLIDSQDARAAEGAPRDPFDRTREQMIADWRKWMVAS